MYKAIEEYLNSFRDELKGSDRATIQDALADAEDHLTTAVENKLSNRPVKTVEEAVRAVIEQYGTPDEVADHYRVVEEYTTPVLAASKQKSGSKGFARFCSIITEPVAWGALLYMIFALATGIIYFTWAVTGLSLSAGLIVLIIGVPLTWLFFLSFRGIALVEGRIVEALLGVRMPRRTVFIRKGNGWWGSVKGVFTTRSTWSSLVYLILMLPLGVLYFSVFITLIAVSLSMIADPILELVFRVPVFDFPVDWWTPVWLMPFVVVAGALLFLSTLHLAKLTGKIHGKFARTMLVS
ncbi:MAG: sensor domain-containing protein, partial [Candidatus Aegiribacteria sp.]|nr:sensor domain-containing protein [Candidatus Aegiribacteria sp.]